MKIYLVLYKTNDPDMNDTFEHIIASDLTTAQNWATKRGGVVCPVNAAGGLERDFNIPTYKLEIGKQI